VSKAKILHLNLFQQSHHIVRQFSYFVSERVVNPDPTSMVNPNTPEPGFKITLLGKENFSAVFLL